MDPREAQDGSGGSSPELGRRRQLSVGELCSLFEARCAMASRQLPEPARKSCRPRNGVLQAVIPQLTVTSEEDGGEAQRSPAMLPPTEPNGAWLTTDSSLHLLQSSRRLSTSSLSSTGSSSLFEDSEDDLLSDTEGRSQGIVHLEHGEETHQEHKAEDTSLKMMNETSSKRHQSTSNFTREKTRITKDLHLYMSLSIKKVDSLAVQIPSIGLLREQGGWTR